MIPRTFQFKSLCTEIDYSQQGESLAPGGIWQFPETLIVATTGVQGN